MITVLEFVVRTPQSAILPTLAQGALWALCIVTIVLAFQGEIRTGRSRVPHAEARPRGVRERA